MLKRLLDDERVKNGRVVMWLFMLLMIAGSVAYLWELHVQRNGLLQANEQLAKTVVKQQRVIDLFMLQQQIKRKQTGGFQLHQYD